MPSAKTRKRQTSKAAYIEGSAARNLYAFPEERYPENSPKKPKKKADAPRQRPVVRKATTTLPLSGTSVLVLAVAAIVTLVICVQYVQLQSEITYRLKRINRLETELNDLILLNNEADKRINLYIDLDYIYQVATQELGMRYADKDQILRYNNSGAEYVRQYKDIPE